MCFCRPQFRMYILDCNVGRCPQAQRQNLLNLLNSLNKVTWFNLVTLWNVGNVFYYHYAIQSRFQRLNSRNWPKTPFFGTVECSKTHFSDFWMNLHELVTLLIVGKRLILLQYAISARSNRPKKWRKWPKMSFLKLWIIHNSIFGTTEWSISTFYCW